ncbi:MAG TPA: alpha/beta fold hydrolase [Acidimicrobiales bacterium]|nr:alpha/beta fold hydrolase [Acidimicrobiales bacterium]
MPLHVEMRGDGPPLVLLHGFTQTGRLWGSFGEGLTRSHTVVALDLPGHAGSDAVRADLPTTAAMVADAVRHAVGDARCDVLGYSLGARVALHVLTGTDLAPTVGHLVCVGVTAGIEDPAERERRRAADEAAADALETSGDVDRFLNSWLAGPLFERLGDAADRAERRRNSAPGLASSLRLCGTGTQEPLWGRLGQLRCPVLALAGTDDSRFSAHALRVARLAPRGVASLVPGGGHAAHLAQPEHTWRLVEHWLSAVDPG